VSIAAVAGLAALAAFGLTPLVASAAGRRGAIDLPGGRRRHPAPVPRGGGAAIGVAFLVTSALVIGRVGMSALGADNPDAALLLRGLLFGGLLAVALGWIDDLKDLGPRGQLAGQLALAGVAISHRLWLQVFANPLSGGIVDLRRSLGADVGLVAVVVLTVVWYSGFINTVNWLDGVDGLAATVGATAAALFAAHMVSAFGQAELALFPAALAGACLGFLPWNVPRARVFLGSSGTTFLGFTLAGLALVAPAKVATALLVMSVPIVDVAWQILYRARRGQAPWIGDRGHLHHRLYDRGWSPARVVALYAGLSAALGGGAVVLPQAMGHRGQIKLAALALVALAAFAGLWLLTQHDES